MHGQLMQGLISTIKDYKILEECAEDAKHSIPKCPNTNSIQIHWDRGEFDFSSLGQILNSFSSVLKAITDLAEIDYSMDICFIPTKGLSVYEDKEKFCKLCEEGCANYARKWSCPPFAPHFTDYVLEWKKIFVFYLRIDLEQFSYIKNDYLKVKAANAILKSRSDKFLRKMAEKHGKYISSGSCRFCKPCKCKSGSPCAHPNVMTYSFEAMGIDVGQLVSNYFQKPLLWYKPQCPPKYTSVVCGLLTNEELTVDDLYNEYSEHIIR